MKKEKIPPVLYLMGICTMLSGLVFPFALVEKSISSLIFFLAVGLAEILIECGYTRGEQKEEKKEQLKCLRKENTFFRYVLPIYRLSALSYLPMMISKIYSLRF